MKQDALRGVKMVHRSVSRIDAVEKITGRALYAADLFLPGMLWGKVLFAAHPHARILSLDTAPAAALPGVKAVLTAADIPGAKEVGAVLDDQPALAVDRVRFLGDGVALVAADTQATAEEARKHILVAYEPLPAVFSTEEALTPGAPALHETRPDNVVNHHRVRKGDLAAAFQQAEVTLEREYRTQLVEHAYLEPEAVLAIPDPDHKGVQVIGSIQNPFSTRSFVARALALDLNRVRISQSTLGGSFGGKDEVMYIMAIRAALLALKCGRPVKMVNDREDSLRESYKRHPYKMRYKVGATREGKLTAMEIQIVADAGAYASQSPFVTWRSAVEATGPYQVPAVSTDVTAVYTNNTYTGAMRGFGSPQVIFAVESLMDELAAELGIDPVELRRRNLYRQGSITATNQVLDGHAVSLEEVLNRTLAAIEWNPAGQKVANPDLMPSSGDSEQRRGLGLALSFRGCSLGAEGLDSSTARCSLEPDGSVLLALGISENGAGQRTVFTQIAAQTLGLPLERIRILDADTYLAPDAGPTVASRGTLMGGNAVLKAAAALRSNLQQVGGTAFGLAPAEVRITPQGLAGREGQLMGWGPLVQAAQRLGTPLHVNATYQAPAVDWEEERGQGNAYFTYVYACQAVEVEVDTATGQVRVLRVAAAHDLGRAINPQMARGQIHGGVAMGLGYALLEEVELRDGETRTLNFDTYELPTAADMPQVIPILVENPDAAGPYGAKSLGEPTNELLAAAVANAIANATGRRIRELPCDLERVLLGISLREKREKRSSQA
ncbi:MAG: xanthine dehydrogenase family protein molybdopterin-binding subunit [bacterium]